ncbi:MAG: NAD(P)-dependent oxidoreductase [Candidatus Stygibacter australis]|nr:NAD(P)-dependent oxidoreductase [Candidatus Stygibacter australis]MDP8322818.1 NAD(P)-dependent oxidoreductase [Candidatus Stygibacter australis]
MNKKLLLTGATGFIGRHIVQQLSMKKYDITLLVRPETNKKRLDNLPEKAEIILLDLRNINKLKKILTENTYDAIIHAGAIRNRPQNNADDYLKANVQSTEQLALHAIKNQSKFMFFSSVGVFGSVPVSLPPEESSPRVGDNLYHQSKIQAESLVNRYVLYGLNSVIIRPAITYGTGDFGFPYSLIKMIDKNKILLPKQAPSIHLANVDLLVSAVQQLLQNDYQPGKIYNIADRNPVDLLTLADTISQELKGKDFDKRLIIPNWYFNTAARIAGLLGNKAWASRFQLFSRSWYYNVEAAYEDLKLKNIETTTGIRSTVQWYKKIKQIKKN